jgi:hypothetical protein
MGNLSDIRQTVYDRSSREVDRLDYKVMVDRAINSAHRLVWNVAAWPETYRETYIDVRPDITGSTSLALTGTVMGRQIDFSSAVRELGGHLGFNDWYGQDIEIEGRDYSILWIESDTRLYINEPLRTTGSASGTIAYTDWKIKHRYYDLPPDCAKVTSVSQQTRPIPGQSTWEALGVPIVDSLSPVDDHDQASSQATKVFKVPFPRIPPGEMISGSVTNTSYAFAIPNASKVELAWCFARGNQYGPISSGTILETNASQNGTFTLTFKDRLGRVYQDLGGAARSQTDKAYPLRNEGFFKRVVWNANLDPTTGLRNGEPDWHFVSQFHPSGSIQIEHLPASASHNTGTMTISFAGQIDPSFDRWRSYTPQRIQPFPRLTGFDKDYPYTSIDSNHVHPKARFKRLLVQYRALPDDLLTDQDTSPIAADPDFPRPDRHQGAPGDHDGPQGTRPRVEPRCGV